MQPVDEDLQLLLLVLVGEAVGWVVLRIHAQALPVLGQKLCVPEKIKERKSHKNLFARESGEGDYTAERLHRSPWREVLA